MGSRIKLFGGGLLIGLAASISYGADIYVSPTGSDGAAGTIAAPLQTLTAARDKADQLKATNPPVTIYLRGGTYYLPAPVVFGPANSGTASAPIVYTAYPGERPVISGGIKVNNPTWIVSAGSIMVTTIATNQKVDQLFLNGQRQILARYPNFDTSKDNGLTRRLDGYNANCIAAARVALWANPAEGPGYIRAMHNNEWGSVSFIMTGKNGTTLNYTWVGDNNRGSVMHGTYRMVENLFEELDAAGEWFYRKSTGQLFFWPPAGTNLSTATIELASQDELLRFVGTSPATANSVKYIQFNNITFTHTFRTLFSKPYELILQSDWGIARAGAIFMQNAENITIQNCLFDQIGGNGIFCSGYNQKHVIYNNDFEHAGASCIALVGLTSSVRCPSSWSGTPTCTDRVPGPLTNEYPTFVLVDNNMMNHFGRFEKQTAGVNMSMTQCDTVRHNSVHDCPRAGINWTDGCWGGHVVEFNWVYNSVLETSDHGPCNAWGRDRIERWKADSSASRLDSWKTVIIRNNRFEVRSGYFGIDLDDRASNYNQYNNLLIGGGLKIATTRFNTYKNNICIRGANNQFHGSYPNAANYGAHNIYYGYNLYQECCFIGFELQTATNVTQIPSTLRTNSVVFDSNIVYHTNGSQPFIADWGGTATVLTWAQWTGGGQDVHSVIADPMFTDSNKTWPVRPNGFQYLPRGDFSVRTGSPALALGFRNFPMDSFGVMSIPGPNTAAFQHPFVYSMNKTGNDNFNVHYGAGRLTVSYDGEYLVTVTTALGRTVKVYNGKGRSSYKINATSSGAGVYFAVIRAKSGVATRKFIVN
jgi:hypothetical protein